MLTLIRLDRLGARTIEVKPERLRSMFRAHELKKLRAGLIVRKGGCHRRDAKQRRLYLLKEVA